MADLFIYSKEVNGFSTTLSCIWLGNLFTINVSVCYTHNLTIIVQRNICQVSLQVYHIYIYIYIGTTLEQYELYLKFFNQSLQIPWEKRLARVEGR